MAGATNGNNKMMMWDRYKKYLCSCPSIGLTLDVSRMNFDDGFLASQKAAMEKAFTAMDKLEGGSLANPDEKDDHGNQGRMVGHYWLRDSRRAPKEELRIPIDQTLTALKKFAAEVHNGRIVSSNGGSFTDLLVIGIGGSALGPQFVADALTSTRDRMDVHFFDNTDPDGMDRTMAKLEGNLANTLVVVISKSGSTKETRNGMLVAAEAYEAAGLPFPRHAVAVTGEGSELDKLATRDKWRARFPMWDWVGGRTSVLSAVGLLPAALQGFDIDLMLAGARETDGLTRVHDIKTNPAALLALMWYSAGCGKGAKDMVILPYKDRLALFSKYLQQLIMESLGKEKDRTGKIVNQGIAVYGNKGSTDQHAYVQQLREGVNNFFVTFIEVLKDRALGLPGEASELMVEPDVTSGDYLHGFFQGTRRALAENGRESMTITVDEVSPRTIGVLIALYERAVGLYAELIDINAYHQPGVEAGKKAATAVIALQSKIVTCLRSGNSGTAEEIAKAIGAEDEVETVYLTLRHLSSNPEHGVVASTPDALTAKYQAGTAEA